MSLKQGAGRLIRSETDRGLLVVCDPRMATMGYGRRLLRRAAADDAGSSDEAEALGWLDALAAEAPARRLPRAAHQSCHQGVVLVAEAVAVRYSLFGKFCVSTRSASSRSCVRPSAS